MGDENRRIKRPLLPACYACGGLLEWRNGGNRTREFLHEIHITIPDDFYIAVCTHCNEINYLPCFTKQLDDILEQKLMKTVSNFVERKYIKNDGRTIGVSNESPIRWIGIFSPNNISK